MLRVKGDSMVEAGILDGDYVVVQRQQTARDGDIVVALVGDDEAADEATVKRFFRENGRDPPAAGERRARADVSGPRAGARQGRGRLPEVRVAMGVVEPLNRTLEQELLASSRARASSARRAASSSCTRTAGSRVPECGSRLERRAGEQHGEVRLGAGVNVQRARADDLH